MGMFKQLKQAKHSIEAAPGMIAQAQELGAQAQQMAVAQQAAAAQAAAQAQAQAQAMSATAAPAAGGDLEPIAGVSLELYAEISKGLAAYNYDQSKGADVAAAKGVTATSWEQAMAGWNDRIKADPAVARQFNKLYTGR